MKSKNGKPDGGLQVFRGSLPVSLVWLSDLRRYEIFSRDILVKILITMDKGTKKEMAIPL